MDLVVHVPINSLSFGQTSVAILKEFQRRGLSPYLFLIGNPDLSAQAGLSEDFTSWLNSCVNKALRGYRRSMPSFKLWHLNGSDQYITNKQLLFTFHECDQPTREELNIIRNTTKVAVCCDYTKEVFSDFGADNITTIPLGFDKDNFKKIDRQYFDDGRIVFNLCGKFENRKHHRKTIQAWIKKFGNNKKYFLQCALWNNFLNEEDNKKLFVSAVEGKNYCNVQFLGFMPQNAAYNDYLNSAGIVIGCSGAETWDLPVFQSVCLGKHAVILDATGYKMWANKENSILIKPNAKIPVYDGIFFNQGGPFNQGNIYSFDDDAFIAGCEDAIKRYETNPVNMEGVKLQEQFTYAKTTDMILKELESL